MNIQKLITFVLFYVWEPPTAQIITRAVRRINPAIEHKEIVAGLQAMFRSGAIFKSAMPHLPSRYTLSHRARETARAGKWLDSKTWQARKKQLVKAKGESS